jgi:hypothetical protein
MLHRIGFGCCARLVLLVYLACAIPAWSAAADRKAPANARSGAVKSTAPEDVSPNAWPKLSDQEQASAVKELKNFADDSMQKIGRPLTSVETQYFLFCTDLPNREAAHWANLLDRMYGRLAELFGVKPGVNIWSGKALIFVFAKPEDFYDYEKNIEHYDARKVAGLCHAFGDGTVRVAFFREDDELTFAHVLVHESVHGFVHRYRGMPHIPSWINEGLAEAIAGELVPRPGRANTRGLQARELIQQHHNDLGNFFTTDHIEDWQYPVAEKLTAFMILQSKQNYVAFINGIKDGQDWQESLEKNYKAPLDRLVPAFGQWLGVRGLRAPSLER